MAESVKVEENAFKAAIRALLNADNQIDPTTGTVKLKATFDNRDGALVPDQFVVVRLLPR